MLLRSFNLATLTLIASFSSFSAIAESSDINQLKAEAISIVKQFGGALKPQLKKALTEGGVEQAVKVCSVKAPEIAKKLSDQTHWQVKRVSLKARNSNTANPDVWETATLKSFEQKRVQGESAKTMAKAEIVGNKFRFMKAQGVAPLCLTCHGTKLTSETKDVLKHYYANDKAIGYTLGQIRGAFSLTKQL
jgi:hypothetical protein